MTDVDMTFKTPAHLALLNYSQADEDGVMVLVSRQAIHEVSAEITRLRARLEEAEAAKADAWDECVKAAEESIMEYTSPPDESFCEKRPDEGDVIRAVWAETTRAINTIRALVNPYRSKTDET